ncbi:MAG TPA: hypothetical protein VLZ53_04145, partial [Devosia sp.]|nr:hypothetical protein [Devosia sp.]
QFNRDLLTQSKAALAAGKWPADVLAALEKNPKYALLTRDQMLPGLEYGGTAKGRVLINARVAFQQLRGEPVTTNFAGFLPGEPGAPPPGAAGAPRGAPPPSADQH